MTSHQDRADLGESVDDDRAIAHALAEVAVEMRRLTEQLGASQPKLDAISRRSVWQIVMAGLVAATTATLIGVLVVGVVLVSTITDCTTKDGACYQSSQDRTAAAEARIIGAQAEASQRTLGAVCAVFERHDLTPPSECMPVAPTTTESGR